MTTLKELAGSLAELSRVTAVSEPTLRTWLSGEIPLQRSPTARAIDEWVVAETSAARGEKQQSWRQLRPSLVELTERYRDAVVRGDDTPSAHEPPTERDRRSRTWLLGVAVLVVVVAALVAWRVGASGSGSGSGSDTPTHAVPVSATLTLDQSNFCSWKLGTHPIPLVSSTPLVMRVDARCNTPANPDPVADRGVAVYSVTSNTDPSKKLTFVKDGTSVVPTCFVPDAQEVGDVAKPPNSSPIWIRLQTPSGYIPDVNLGGGYTEAQLRSLGLPRC